MNARDILQAMTEQKVDAPFFDKTCNWEDPRGLATLVKELRKQGNSPKHLNTFIEASATPCFDVCGTGGAGGYRLNTSTILALLAPSLGVNIVKHGGRSASGKVGSLDFLEILGLKLDRLFETCPESLRTLGVAFLPAGFTYSFMGTFSSARKAYGKPTLFNLLGPLLNPALPHNRILGAYHPEKAQLLAQTLLELDEQGCVVCSQDAEGYLDEASPFAENHLYFVGKTSIQKITLAPICKPPLTRKVAFQNGAQAGQDLLSGIKNPETDMARQLLALNYALIDVKQRKQNTDFANHDMEAELQRTYHAVLSDFDAILASATSRLHRLRDMIPKAHDSSPVLKRMEHLENQAGTALRRDSKFTPLLKKGEKLKIAEVKIKSPTDNFQSPLPLQERVKAYEKFANAISVVTHPSFGGSLALLKEIRQLTDLPLLAKDFVRTPEHVESLAKGGADGILLLQDMLTEEQLDECFTTTQKLGLSAIVESTWSIPRKGDFTLLNSRNLHSLFVSKESRDQIASQPYQQPRPPVVIASSLETQQDMLAALSLGGGVLVGGTLMKCKTQTQLEEKLAEVFDQTRLLKVCGARSPQDVENSIRSGANFVGINLIPSSKRRVDSHTLKAMLPTLETYQHHCVFLTDNRTARDLLDRVAHLESYEQPYETPRLAKRIGTLNPLPHVRRRDATLLVLDGSQPGSGQTWNLRRMNLDHTRKASLLAGGITEDTVQDRVQQAASLGIHVIGVDTASGVENQEQNGFDFQKIQTIKGKLS